MIVKIKELRCKAFLGIFEWEKKRNILFNITYSLKNNSQNKTQVVYYDKLAQEVTGFLENKTFDLVENLSQELTHFLFQKENMEWIEIECIKPDALANAKAISVICKK